MNPVRRRLAQGLRALFAFATPPDLALARRYLTDCEFAAFRGLSRSEQLHSLNVLRTVLAAAPNPPQALSAAALLHDVGKSRRRLAVWQKTLVVLALSLTPRLSHWLSREQSPGAWRTPFTVQRHHPKWGGEILRACGSDSQLIWLVEHHQAQAKAHQAHPAYALLKRLQAADNAN